MVDASSTETWRDEGHFLFCANDLYAQHMAACIVSLLENSSLTHHDLCVVGKFEDPSVAEKLQTLVAAYPSAALRIINFLPSDELQLPTRMHWTSDTFSRFWVSEFFDDTVGRVLYLDSDMIIRGDIAPLWRMELGDKMFGAVSIPGSEQGEALGVPDGYGYFNNGVLLIDMVVWRKEQPLKKLLPYIEAKIEHLPYLDQDALNACYFDKRQPLDFRWNMIVPFTWANSFIPMSKADRRTIVNEALICHYNGRSKPWHYLNDHPHKGEYWRYIRKTPWWDAFETGKSFKNRLKKLFNKVTPLSFQTWLWRLRGHGDDK